MRRLLSLAVAITLTTSLLIPKKSEAIVGASTGSVPVMIVGATLVGATFVLDAGLFSLLIGTAILDEKGESSPSYVKISDNDATKLGLTKDQQNNFNRKVSSINQIAKSIAKTCATELAKEKNTPLEKMILEESDIGTILTCTDNNWEQYKESNSKILTDEVFGVIQALRTQKI